MKTSLGYIHSTFKNTVVQVHDYYYQHFSITLKKTRIPGAYGESSNIPIYISLCSSAPQFIFVKHLVCLHSGHYSGIITVGCRRGKKMFGKLYSQFLCGGEVFLYLFSVGIFICFIQFSLRFFSISTIFI